MIWKILEIEKTKDEEVITNAYRAKLHFVNPEDDQEGFKELRRAYEEAIAYAREDDSLHNVDSDDENKDEIDLWIDRIDKVYQDVITRIDKAKWDKLLHDEICEDLDMELEAAEKLLVYFMSHSFMPQEIWQLVDKRFRYLDNYDQLKEKFPENYLEYIKWQIEHANFIDFSLFDGKTDDKVDDYINTLYEVKNALEDRDLERTKKGLGVLEKYDVTHPYGQVEKARYLLLRHLNGEKDLEKEALSIMEDLDFEYSDNAYIERIYAETLVENDKVDKAKAIFDNLLEENPENYGAMLGQANCIYLLGDAEEAKERIEDILEERVQDTEALSLLETINDKLIAGYEKEYEETKNREVCFKLGWCFYQKKEFEKGIALLDEIEETEDYDYINLRCRLYLANEDYEKGYPYTKKWLSLIENTIDDGTKEMQKRLNRLSLAHFSIGICLWELTLPKFKENPSEELDKKLVQAADFIKAAVKEEENVLVKLSYMEQLSRFYIEEKKYEACIDLCDEIIQVDRGFFPAYVHRQKANYKLKNAKEVIDDYFACIELYPGYVKPYIYAAEVFMAFEQYDDVESVIEAAKNAGIESDSLKLIQVKILHYKDYSNENTQKALDIALGFENQVLENEETDLEDLAELGKEIAILYWDLDEDTKALGILDIYQKKCPDSISLWHLQADIYSKQKRYKEALDLCHKLLKREPNSFYTKMKLGNLLERMDEPEAAIKYYKEILVEDSEYVPAIRRMMYVYSYTSNSEQDLHKCRLGIEYATKLIELTGAAEGYVERGNLYIDLYELEKAIEDCEKAIQLDPEGYYAYNNLGCALLKLRRVEEAIVPLEKLIEMYPDKETLPYLNLVDCYMLQKEYDKCIKMYEKIQEIAPNDIRFKKNIAKVYVESKQYEKAIEIYEKLVTEDKKKIFKAMFKGATEKEETNYHCTRRIVDNYCSIGDVYVHMGDKKKANVYYKKAYNIYFEYEKQLPQKDVEDIAEFYRDCGALKKALKVLKEAQRTCYGKNYISEYLSFTYATIYFELGNKQEAKKHANAFIKSLLKDYESVEDFLSDRRYLPMHLYDLGIMNICAGELEKAREYFMRIKANDCKLCVICETCDCFEYYFGMGLLSELQGDYLEAKKFYKRAIEIKGSYPCCEKHLMDLEKKTK